MRAFLFLIFLTCSVFSFSQRINSDSLILIIHKPQEDSNKVKAAYELSYVYTDNNRIDSALYYASMCFEISERINWKFGREFSLVRIAEVMSESGNNPKSLELLFEALKIAEKKKDLYLFKIYATIGIVYNRLKNYEEAIFYHILSIKFRNNAGLDIPAAVYSNLADAFLNHDQLDSALKYQNKAYELSTSSSSDRWLVYSACNLGNIHSRLHNFIIANAYYKTAAEMPYLQKRGNDEVFRIYSEIYLGLAINYKELGSDDSSYFFARRAFDYALKTHGVQKSLQAALFLKDYFKDKKPLDSVLKYQAMVIAYMDSAYNLEKLKKVEGLRIGEVYRQEELKAQQKKDREYRKSNIQLSLIAVFIPIFAAFVYFLSRKKRKNSKVIILLGITSLLMLFEFVSLLIHPSIEKITKHNALLMYLILLMIAFILVPVHHRLEKLVKKKL